MKMSSTISLPEPISPVLVFTGSDSFCKEKALENVIALLGEKRGLGVERFDPEVDDMNLCIEEILTPSLFNEERLVIVRRAQKISKTHTGKFDRLLREDLPGIHLAFVFESDAAARKPKRDTGMLNSLLEREEKQPDKFTVLDYEKPPEYKLAQWLTDRVPLIFNRKISKKDAELFLETTGTSLDKVYGELQKLDIYLPDKAPIDAMAIKTLLPKENTATAQALASALATRDPAKTMYLVDELFTESLYLPTLIASLFQHFWKLYKIRAYGVQHRQEMRRFFSSGYEERIKIAFALGVATKILATTDSEKKAYPILILSGIIDQARLFSFGELKQVFAWLREFDVGIKTGKVKPSRQSLLLLCYRILKVALTGEDQSNP